MLNFLFKGEEIQSAFSTAMNPLPLLGREKRLLKMQKGGNCRDSSLKRNYNAERNSNATHLMFHVMLHIHVTTF